MVHSPRVIHRSVVEFGKRFLSIALVFMLLVAQTPAAPKLLQMEAAVWWADVIFWLRTVEAGNRAKPRAELRQEQQSERAARLARLEILPGRATVVAGSGVVFTAIGRDRQGNPIGGLEVVWWCRQVESHKQWRLIGGAFDARVAGSYTVTAESGGLVAQASVTVTDENGQTSGGARRRALRERASRRVSSKDGPAARSSTEGAERAGSPDGSGVEQALVRPPDDSGWGEDNYWAADDPVNRVGDPPGYPQDDGAGSGNFQLAAPVVSLPGRGLSVALTLAITRAFGPKPETRSVSMPTADGPRPAGL